MPWSPARVAQDPALTDYALSPRHVRAFLEVYISTGGPVDLDDPDGAILTSQEAAARLSVALDEAEAVERSGVLDPRGFRLSVNVVLEGFRDEDVLLTWSLEGVDVGADWRAEHIGVRIRPTTDLDGGNVDIWVPDLKASGRYNVEVKLFRVSDGARLTADTVEVPA